MVVAYNTDVAAILARRHDNGADHWATPDRRLAKGGPFSTLGAARLELGEDPGGPLLSETAELIWAAWRDDGRFRLAPGAIYPCQTAHAACTLAHLGRADDPRLKITLEHLLSTLHTDCGWRCNKFSYGHGPETEFSNPGPTLIALDAYRFTELANNNDKLDRAVEFLLSHWVSRAPLGPCHYGIGTLFMQVSYPLADYNLFSWLHVLSHYDRARSDPRFLEALACLEAKLVDGEVVPERVSKAMSGLQFCRKGAPSTLATRRYREVRARMAGDDSYR
ncbi:hypothetical protein PROP_03104 [Propionicimonas sp. T2.31MG-18]